MRRYDRASARTVLHLNVCSLKSEIACVLPRGECQECQRVFIVKAPWKGRSRGLIQKFEGFALTLMREMPMRKSGEIYGGDGAQVVADVLCAREY